MKLIISRGQARKLLGGVKFELKARTELTSDEMDLVKKYKADKEGLIKKDIKVPFTGHTIELFITIGGLISGQTFKCSDIGEILETERNVKEACEAFKVYLEATLVEV